MATDGRSAARVDFYFGVEHRLHYACRIVRKARGAGKSLLAYARDADRLARFDAALWTFSALDFLPHVYADSPLAVHTPVLLTLTPQAPVRDLLLNLDDEPPAGYADWFGRFERVLEVVSQEDADRAAARQRFKTYRDGGLTPNAIQVGAD
jgi:DNA polymerase-3 subunit chi